MQYPSWRRPYLFWKPPTRRERGEDLEEGTVGAYDIGALMLRRDELASRYDVVTAPSLVDGDASFSPVSILQIPTLDIPGFAFAGA